MSSQSPLASTVPGATVTLVVPRTVFITVVSAPRTTPPTPAPPPALSGTLAFDPSFAPSTPVPPPPPSPPVGHSARATSLALGALALCLLALGALFAWKHRAAPAPAPRRASIASTPLLAPASLPSPTTRVRFAPLRRHAELAPIPGLPSVEKMEATEREREVACECEGEAKEEALRQAG